MVLFLRIGEGGESFESAVRAALGGGRGNLELGGDLVGSEALIVAEDDELAVFLGKRREGLVEFGGELGLRFRVGL